MPFFATDISAKNHHPWFSNPGESFRHVLREHFLTPVAKWLLGSEGGPYLLPQTANSAWECSLATIYLLRFYEELDSNDPMRAEIESKTVQTARWMYSKAVRPEESLAHWEGVTWDTAVCARAILLISESFPQKFTQSEKDDLQQLIEDSVRWLVRRFNGWQTEVIYPFGPADIAQILHTLLYVQRFEPSLGARAVEDVVDEGLIGAIHSVVEYLVSCAEHSKFEDEDICHWGDFFTSAEIIDCLSAYVRQSDELLIPKPDKSLVRRSSQSITQCLRYLENNQVDGRWGAHADTCISLYAYIRATDSLEGTSQEDHLVLKALRWICDEKQRFSDGSFMHTTFITVFYALALWETYTRWPIAKLSVFEVYDLALWSSPVRSTPERGLRLELQLKMKDVEEENARLYDYQTQTIKFFAVVSVLLLLWAGGGVFAFRSETVNLKFDTVDLRPLLAILITLSVTIGGLTVSVVGQKRRK